MRLPLADALAHTPAERLTAEFDIPGDATGVLQAGLPFYNLHHWGGGGWSYYFGQQWHREPFEQLLLLKRVSDFVGGDNMFKRFVFGEGRWLLTMGYSITLFDKPLSRDAFYQVVRAVSSLPWGRL